MIYSKSGSKIETLRKPLSRVVAILFGIAIISLVPSQLDSFHGELYELSGFLLLILAAMGRIWCSIYISGRKDRELCVFGPYAHCRNPLYFFSFLGVTGIGLGLQSVFLTLTMSATYLFGYYFIIRSEESRLEWIFGSEFNTYRERTPRFFPRFSGGQTIEQHSVNPRIIEKSLREVVWFLLAIVFIEVVEMAHSKGIMTMGHFPF